MGISLFKAQLSGHFLTRPSLIPSKSFMTLPNVYSTLADSSCPHNCTLILIKILSVKSVSSVVLVTQLCPTLGNPMDCSPPGPFCPLRSPGKNSGVDSYSLLQGIFLTRGSNPRNPHCKQIPDRFLTIEPPEKALCFLLDNNSSKAKMAYSYFMTSALVIYKETIWISTNKSMKWMFYNSNSELLWQDPVYSTYWISSSRHGGGSGWDLQFYYFLFFL